MCCSTEFKCVTSAITDSITVTAVPTASTSFSLHYLKYMKTLYGSSTSDIRHVLHASQLTPQSTCLTMEQLTSGTENTSMSPACTAVPMSFSTCWARWTLSKTSSWVSLPWLVEGYGEGVSGALSNNCKIIQKGSTNILTISSAETSVSSLQGT